MVSRMSNAQHSNAKNTWYTPAPFIDAARQVFAGRIGLDPASDAQGNEVVKAAEYLTKEQDGLTASWGYHESVWLNPPGKIKKPKDAPFSAEHRPLPKLFWQRLQRELGSGRIGHAIFAAFSVEQLQQSQSWGGKSMLQYPFCIPRKRVAWNPPDGQKAKSPTHAAAFIYLPGSVDMTDVFTELFLVFGQVVQPLLLF